MARKPEVAPHIRHAWAAIIKGLSKDELTVLNWMTMQELRLRNKERKARLSQRRSPEAHSETRV